MKYATIHHRISRRRLAVVFGVVAGLFLTFGVSVKSSYAVITGCCIAPSVSCTDNVAADACKSPKMFFANVNNCRLDAQTKTACDKVLITSPKTAVPATRTTTTTKEKTPEPLMFVPNVPIPNLFGSLDSNYKGEVVDETLFGRYINAFYIYFAGVAGILAVVMIMWGGYHYVTSFGNPQRMNQGKEIISSALIGLILVLTSYLLLNIINPRLTKLIIPSVGYYDRYLGNADQYCEGQDINAGDNLATDAARAQGKVCGPDNKVTYKDASGKERTCFSLALPPDHVSEATLAWDKQFACFYKKVAKVVDGSTQLVSEFGMYKAAGTDGLCEAEEFTRDADCNVTQIVLSLQPHLKGACKKADVSARVLGMTGKDVCHYYQYLACPTDTQQVPCDYLGSEGNNVCWKDGKPAQSGGLFNDNVRAHCVNPSMSVKPIEHVDAVCCRTARKDVIVCDTPSALLPFSKAANWLVPFTKEVSCAPYNADTTMNFGGLRIGGFGVSRGTGPATCSEPKKCLEFLNMPSENITSNPF